ncbi:hypothetical protein EJB05_28490, partial [Eragrostis curvula]
MALGLKRHLQLRHDEGGHQGTPVEQAPEGQKPDIRHGTSSWELVTGEMLQLRPTLTTGFQK